MRRRRPMIALTLLLVVPLAAQAPAGWRVHVDPSQNASDPDNTPNLTFAAMGKGFHIVGGPAGVFWNAANSVTGNYTAKATFNLMQPSNHTNYYGLIIGGSDLEGPNWSYIYFLLAQDGTYLVKHRAGRAVSDVQRATPHQAIRRPDAKGQSTNAMEVRVVGNTISYVINGSVVHTTPKTGLTAKTDGIAGVRINHVLNVHVEGFEVQKN